jgi:hypothetical protein
LRQLRNGTQINELFIAADTDRARDRWLARASSAGFRPWANTGILLDRRDPRAVEAAISDWLTLGRARGLVFSSASSFGQEAAVLSGNLDHTHALRAGLIRRASRDARTKLTQGWQHLRPSE